MRKPLLNRSRRVATPVTCGPDATGTFPTIAEAILRLQATTDFSLPRRRTMASGLRRLARMMGSTPETVRLDPAVVGPALKCATPASCDVKPSTLAACRVDTGTVMRWLGLIDLPNRSQAPLGEAWSVLRDALPDQFINIQLQALMAYCDANGIAPDAVTDQTVVAYGEALKSRRLTRNPADRVGRVVRAWNRARRIVPIWPAVELRTPASEDGYSRPFSLYPASFQAGIEAYKAAIQKGGSGSLFDSAAGIADASLQSYLSGIRVAAAALVETGVPIETILSVDILITPENIRRAIDFHWRRAGGKRTRHTGGIAAALGSLARHCLGAGSPAYAELRPLLKAAKPKKQSRMTVTNERRLAQFDDPQKLAMMLHLPEALFAEAEAQKAAGDLRIAAWTAGVAVAVATELRCPMRSRTLAGLRLGHSLLRLGGRKPVWAWFEIPPEDKKTEGTFRWPVARETSGFIDRYLKDFRPLLGPAAAASPFLFPGRDKADEPRSEIALSRAISEAIWRFVGADMNLHLFRAFAGKLILDDNPGALEDLRLLLDQTTLDTALRYYRSHQPAAAAARIDRVFERRKSETRTLAKAAFAQLKPKPARRKPGAGGEARP
jgi:integrase